MYALLASGGIEGPAHAAAAAKVMVRKKKGEKNAVKMVFSFFFLFTASEDNFFPPFRSEIYGRRRTAFSLSLCSIHEYGWNEEKKVSSMVFSHKNAVLKVGEMSKYHNSKKMPRESTVEQKFELACEYFLTVLSLFPYRRDIFGYRKAFFFSIESGISKKRFLCRSMNRRRKNMHD